MPRSVRSSCLRSASSWNTGRRRKRSGRHHVRNDTGVQEGGEISIFYDPTIAKLVTHAPSRAAAIEAQSAALDAFLWHGIGHNIPFLPALMHHPRWRQGQPVDRLLQGSRGDLPPVRRKARWRGGSLRSAPRSIMSWRAQAAGISAQLNGRLGAARAPPRGVARCSEIVVDIARDGDGIAVQIVDADGMPGQPHHLV